MNPITMTACDSSQIAGYGFDDATGTLAIQFKGGQTYHYSDVPREVFANMEAAESKGKFFGQEIRAQFTHAKIEAEPEIPEPDSRGG